MKKGLYTADQLSNSQYHSPEGNFYSSSQLKKAIKDIELFYKHYVSKELEDKVSGANLDIGNYYHTAILEPHLLEKEYTVYPGKTRRGKEWETFKILNEGKTILTQGDMIKAEGIIKATKSNQLAMDLLEGGKSELSLGINLHGLDIKVRADKINEDNGYLIDLKSTTGNAKDLHKIQETTQHWGYDLSAALYLDAFIAHGFKIDRFIWIYASKDYHNCSIFEAHVDSDIIRIGRAKYLKAIALIKKYEALDWKFEPEVMSLSALPWERDLWLNKKEEVNKKKFTPKTKLVTVIDEDLI